MNIEGKDASEINQLLKAKSDEGARWVAYQKDKESIGKEDLHFFESCNDAQLFCDKSSSIYYQYHYTSLDKLRDALAEGKPLRNYFDEIFEALNKHPIEYRFDDSTTGVIEKLNRREMVPVTYRKDFVPRNEIGRYYVVERSGSGTDVQANKIVDVSFDFEKAKQFYDGEISSAAKDPLRREHQLLLIGEFKNQSLQLDYDAMQRNNKGLLLRMGCPVEDEIGIVKHRDYKTFYELDEPTFSFHSVFAKYDEHSHDLTFYNHKLEEVDPAKSWSHISVACYVGAPAITMTEAALRERQKRLPVDNAPANNSTSEIKEQVKESRVYVQRPKNRLY